MKKLKIGHIFAFRHPKELFKNVSIFRSLKQIEILFLFLIFVINCDNLKEESKNPFHDQFIGRWDCTGDMDLYFGTEEGRYFLTSSYILNRDNTGYKINKFDLEKVSVDTIWWEFENSLKIRFSEKLRKDSIDREFEIISINDTLINTNSTFKTPVGFGYKNVELKKRPINKFKENLSELKNMILGTWKGDQILFQASPQFTIFQYFSQQRYNFDINDSCHFSVLPPCPCTISASYKWELTFDTLINLPIIKINPQKQNTSCDNSFLLEDIIGIEDINDSIMTSAITFGHKLSFKKIE